MAEEPVADVPVEGVEEPVEEPKPDPTLEELYKSARPPVDLVPGVALSAIVNAAWLPKDAKVHTHLLRIIYAA
jgi:hypothetical protein